MTNLEIWFKCLELIMTNHKTIQLSDIIEGTKRLYRETTGESYVPKNDEAARTH